jgi:hypothetical protein
MTEGLDAAILAAIEEWRDVWREVGRLDDEDPAIGNTAERAIRLERKTARMPAMTPEGYHAKVEVIRKAEFDGDVLPGPLYIIAAAEERAPSAAPASEAQRPSSALRGDAPPDHVRLTARTTASLRNDPPLAGKCCLGMTRSQSQSPALQSQSDMQTRATAEKARKI